MDGWFSVVFPATGSSGLPMAIINGPKTVVRDKTVGFDPDEARLMAAAPELLEALKQVMVWIRNWDPDFTQDDEWTETRHCVDAAIAKAEEK
jgi:hypothetical protein